MYDVGVYSIEFVTGIISGKPRNVKSTAIACATGVDEYFNALFEYDSNNVSGRAAAGFNATGENSAFICGYGGYVKMRDFLWANTCELYDNTGKLLESFESDKTVDGFVYQVNHVVDLIQNGKKESDIIPVQDTIDCAEIFDIIKEQNELGMV